MRLFKGAAAAINNDDSESSNVEMRADGEERNNRDGGANPSVVRDNEFSRFFERSLGRAGGALFSDPNFLNGPLGRIADRFDAGASDSGMDDLEIIDESNMAAIQQEMIEAGYSAQEIRDSMRNRLMR